MMFNYPPIYRPYYRNYGNAYKPNSYSTKKTPPFNTSSNTYNEKVKSSEFKAENKNCTNKASNSEENKDFFELFGIKLYFDDLLILGILFFLYTEQVEDESLFFILILLLLS